MNRHQVLELLITRRIPRDLGAIEASLRAIASRVDATHGDHEYDEVHRRLDDLLTARDRVLATADRRSKILV